MTNSDDEIARYKRLFNTATEHAVAYKALMHRMQDEIHALEDVVRMQNKLMNQQGRTIAKLEISLGIDQDL